MPNCFQLFRKGTKLPALSLNKVDEEICEHLGTLPNDRHYVAGWFDCIGYLIATSNERYLGSDALRDKVKEWYPDDNEPMHKILEFMESNYDSTSFYQSSSK